MFCVGVEKLSAWKTPSNSNTTQHWPHISEDMYTYFKIICGLFKTNFSRRRQNVASNKQQKTTEGLKSSSSSGLILKTLFGFSSAFSFRLHVFMVQTKTPLFTWKARKSVVLAKIRQHRSVYFIMNRDLEKHFHILMKNLLLRLRLCGKTGLWGGGNASFWGAASQSAAKTPTRTMSSSLSPIKPWKKEPKTVIGFRKWKKMINERLVSFCGSSLRSRLRPPVVPPAGTSGCGSRSNTGGPKLVVLSAAIFYSF